MEKQDPACPNSSCIPGSNLVSEIKYTSTIFVPVSFLMHIFVRTLRGNLIEVSVSQYTTVKEVKEKIATIEGIEVGDVHLFYNSNPLLQDEAALLDLNIPHRR